MQRELGEYMEKLRETGMADVLFKPIDPTLLFHKIVQWINPTAAS